MIDALIVSQILLGVVVIALAVVCLALARQIGVLHERIAPAGALSVNQRLKVGDAAPRMTVSAIDGRAVAVGENKARSQLFFFLSPDCPICKTLIPTLRSTARAERDWLDLIIASDGGDQARHAGFARDEGLDEFPYVLSEPLGRAFGVGKLPYAALVDEQGRIASMGIVNSREHLESLFRAKELGVASLQEYAARRGKEEQQRAKA